MTDAPTKTTDQIDSGVNETGAFVSELLDVRYNGGCAATLLSKSERWLSSYGARETALCDHYSGNRMLWSQLDLLSRSRERAEAVALNCRQILAKREAFCAENR